MALSFMAFPTALVGKALIYSLATFAGPAPAVHADTASALDTAIAHITTDTGDFAPGHTSLTHYNTPQLCVAAVLHTHWITRRSVDAQMLDVQLQKTPLHDTLPAAAIDLARRCVANFSVTTTLPRDLPELMQLALAANQDSMAAQVVARQLSLASSAAERDSILSGAIETYRTAEPARLAAATALVDRVAETGDAGRRWQLGELERLMSFSQKAWDTASVTRFATRIIDTVNMTPHTHRARLAWVVMDAYRALAEQMYLQSPDSLRPLAQRARQTWADFATPLDTLDRQAMQWDANKSASVEDYMHWLSPVRGMEKTAGVAYPALQASYWFPGKPAAGSPRLVLFSEVHGVLRGGCLTGEIELLYNPSQYCWPFYERIRTLSAKYGAGLQIVLVAITHGNAIRSLPLPPQKEAERLRWYLLDYLKLPVTLAIIDRPVGVLPAPDGRQWRPSVCDSSDPDTDTSATACQYLRPGAVLLNGKGEGVPLWGPEAQQDLIIDRQVSQWKIQQTR
jgi:hypothetical protein